MSDAVPQYIPGKRQFFEVGAYGVFGLSKWSATYVELEPDRFGRTPPTPQHVYVGTRSTYPTLTRSLGFLDTAEHKLRPVTDEAIIGAILEAERRSEEKMVAVVARTRAMDLRNVAREVTYAGASAHKRNGRPA